MTSEKSSDTVNILMAVEDDAIEGSTSEEEENLPEAATYHFNSKKLVVSLLRRLAAVFELLS